MSEYTLKYTGEEIDAILDRAKNLNAGADGKDGKSAYQYAQQGGYTGTEAEFAAKLAAETPSKLPNPHALTVNGTAYDGSVAVDINIEGGVGKETEQGGEIFNDYENNNAGICAHAEGANTTASGRYTHAEGNTTTASGMQSHAEGYSTIASGANSHAEGRITIASGTGAHAEGNNTIAAGNYQHVEGKFNVEDTDNRYAHIIGGGSSNERKNIYTVDWGGNVSATGDVTDGQGNSLARLMEMVDFLLSKVPMNFSIDNKTYKAKYGMTWAEWCESEYNTDGFYVDSNNYVSVDEVRKVTPYGATPSMGTTIIVADFAYRYMDI